MSQKEGSAPSKPPSPPMGLTQTNRLSLAPRGALVFARVTGRMRRKLPNGRANAVGIFPWAGGTDVERLQVYAANLARHGEEFSTKCGFDSNCGTMCCSSSKSGPAIARSNSPHAWSSRSGMGSERDGGGITSRRCACRRPRILATRYCLGRSFPRSA